MPQIGPPAGNSSVAVVNEYLDATKSPYNVDPQGGIVSGAAINQALVDAENAIGGRGKVLLPGPSFVTDRTINVPGTVTLAGISRYTTQLSPSADLGYGVPLINPQTGQNCGVEKLHIVGPYYQTYSPGIGEAPCLMYGVNWGGSNVIRDCSIERFLYGIQQDATFGDHNTLTDLFMSRNLVHIRWLVSGTTGNNTLRDLRTEFPLLAGMSIQRGAFLGGGAVVDNMSIHFPPVGIMFESNPGGGESGILNTVFTNLQLESPSHAAICPDGLGASSLDYKYNRHIGCGTFGFPGAGGIAAGAIQYLNLGGATGGSYTLALNKGTVQTTATITPTSSTPNTTDAATIRTRLLALSNVPASSNPAGAILVYPFAAGYKIHFHFGNIAVNVLTITSSLTGGTAASVVDGAPPKGWCVWLPGLTLGNTWDAIDQFVSGGPSGGLLATNAQSNDFGSAAGLIADQQSSADGWQPIKTDSVGPTGSEPNFCSAGVGFFDDKIPCEIGVVRTFGGAGHLIERGDVVAMVQEGGEPDLEGSAEQYGIAGAGTQDVLPWGVAMSDAYRTANAGDCVVIATRGRLPVKTAVGTTIAAGVKVMPDAANPGCVVTWTSGNPVVGVSRSASGASVVTGRTNSRAAIPGVVIELNPSL